MKLEHRKKVISQKEKNAVWLHIRSFPSIDPHYCREKAQKKYLEAGLNIRRMYDLYRGTMENPVKYHLSTEIFNNEFNIAFQKPKKDLCDKCELFKTLRNPEKKGSYKKNFDVKEVGVTTFDMQDVIRLPKANASGFYCKTKLYCTFR
ncbi:hypothetical protein ILUMI_03166 [Ignelater luminosus]|uniref:Uncharacterized protein n=1 Tax=Ignelater luminosus TaxID=2038154 RepID=A0A8K0DGU5_IGNLU|nr:hypothetical protein ILUMI_03166 [Ignelater luminosus]